MRDADLIRCVFTGAALEPDGNFAAAALHDRLGAGQVVHVDLDPERSKKSHRHAFAFIRTTWENLPDDAKHAPWAQTADTLRKHALIRTGYCDAEMIAVGTDRRAERVAVSMSRLATRLHGYAITEVSGPVVYCFTPESQSLKAMGGARFQASKQAILEWCADLIGVTPDELARMGKKEAA